MDSGGSLHGSVRRFLKGEVKCLQGFARTVDDDATCTGTVAVPTAPSGRVCLYEGSGFGIVGSGAGWELTSGIGSRYGFLVTTEGDPVDTEVRGTWAYTAP